MRDAINAWVKAIGHDNVVTERNALKISGLATFETTNQVSCILKPQGLQELMGCVEIASQYNQHIYVVSQGKNWGYGSEVPHKDKSVVCELKKLDSIIDFDEELGFITVEPGVTFSQVSDFLKLKNSSLFLNAPGSSGDTSVVGNTVERGLCQGPSPQRADQVLGMEVLLSTGQLVRTHTGGLPENEADRVQGYGIGPDLKGLFMQSNFGVVTKLTIALDVMPSFHQQCCLSTGNLTRDLLSALHYLQSRSIVASNVSLFNDYKILGSLGQYPHDRTTTYPLPENIKKEEMSSLEGAKWFVQVSIAGESEDELASRRSQFHHAFEKTELILDFLEVNGANPFFTTDTLGSIQSMYWRKKEPYRPNTQPESDQCGVIWHGVSVPFKSDKILEAVSATESLVLEHGFEPMISIQAVSMRLVYLITSINYDRVEPGHDTSAMKCYQALMQTHIDMGLYPYRLGVQGMGHDLGVNQDYANLVASLKEKLDPKNILSPGRYDFRERKEKS